MPTAFHLTSFCRALLCLVVLGSINPLAAQREMSQKAFDPAPLRSQFTEAVGKDFEIVKDEFKRRSNASGGGAFWLVHVKAKHSGYFTLTYRYNYNDSHYSHVEREFGLGVGPKGCRRGPPHTGSYSRFCVGDTIIFPVATNNFTEHRFSLKSTEYTKEEEAASEKHYPAWGDQNLDRSPVSNTVAEHMQYVGSSSHKMLHRNGGYTLEAYAEFEAQRPGRFNLALAVNHEGMPARVPSALGASTGIPIIIVPRAVPVTLLASRHDVRGYSKGYDGREWVSSSSGDSFMTELFILQPGDRISLKYYTSVRSARYERSERASDSQPGTAPEKVPPPLITKLPFALKTEYNFTEWLVDYLPH